MSAELQPAWKCRLGGKLTSPVVADGRLLVASIDTHTVQALDALFAAGPAMAAGDGAPEPTFDDNTDARLMVFSAKDGQELSRYELDAQPTFDGMAVAGRRLFLSTIDGCVVCMHGNAP